MSHPYKAAAHKNDPKWVKNLNQYVEKAKKDDVTRVIANYGGDKDATMQAAQYPRPKNQDSRMQPKIILAGDDDEQVKAAQAALERIKAREGEDIDAWAWKLAEDLSKFTD